MFQSFFYWKCDRNKEARSAGRTPGSGFQSFFYWKCDRNSVGNGIDNLIERGFNPSSTGNATGITGARTQGATGGVVSILLLLEMRPESLHPTLASIESAGFQSFFYWKCDRNKSFSHPTKSTKSVSILLLLEMRPEWSTF